MRDTLSLNEALMKSMISLMDDPESLDIFKNPNILDPIRADDTEELQKKLEMSRILNERSSTSNLFPYNF